MAKVIIIGGGVAGMSAAHELIERGFEVDVFERNPEYVGGKARSVNVPGSNQRDISQYLPGEHGFRFFPGFYAHLTDTMKRIPVGAGVCVMDNLVSTQTVMISRAGVKPIVMPVNFPRSIKDLKTLFMGFKAINAALSDDDIAFFATKIWHLMTSCQARFDQEYDAISWWEFTGAAGRSAAYQKLLVGGLTRSLVACKAQTASTRTGGAIFLQLIYLMLNAVAERTDRVLNAPTNEAWLTPWINYLKERGVRYHQGASVQALEVDAGKVAAVAYIDPGSAEVKKLSADHYILAVPVECAAKFINKELVSLDPRLGNIIKLALNVEWMNGVQFYLNADLQMHFGHTIYSDSNWALTSISQKQFWPNYDLSQRGNGKVCSILSVDISNWDAPGDFNQKAANTCTPQEIQEEVWAQLKQELNVDGAVVLSDDMLEGFYLDSSIVSVPDAVTDFMMSGLTSAESSKLQKVLNLEPLLVNQCNTWKMRPDATTRVPNLFLASDYVKTHTDLATMEGANEAARRAVNGILRASRSRAARCNLWPLHTPWPLRLLRAADFVSLTVSNMCVSIGRYLAWVHK